MFPYDTLFEVDANRTRSYQALLSIREKTFKIQENKKWLAVGIINYAEHNEVTNQIEVQISHKILPYLCKLMGNYTIYNLVTALQWKSVYSQRFYELCCQYRHMGHFAMDIEQMKELFGIEKKYNTKGYDDFKNYVLLISVFELASAYESGLCDVCFTWSPDAATKIGKKITRINFTIIDRHRETKEGHQEWSFNDYQYNIRLELNRIYPTNAYRIIDKVHAYLLVVPEDAPKILDKIHRIQERYKVREDIARVLRVVFRDDYPILKAKSVWDYKDCKKYQNQLRLC
jgi:hypothetical protein